MPCPGADDSRNPYTKGSWKDWSDPWKDFDWDDGAGNGNGNSPWWNAWTTESTPRGPSASAETREPTSTTAARGPSRNADSDDATNGQNNGIGNIGTGNGLNNGVGNNGTNNGNFNVGHGNGSGNGNGPGASRDSSMDTSFFDDSMLDFGQMNWGNWDDGFGF